MEIVRSERRAWCVVETRGGPFSDPWRSLLRLKVAELSEELMQMKVVAAEFASVIPTRDASDAA
jgi:hypothetical protein